MSDIPDGDTPTPEKIIARMDDSLRSSPVLHVTVMDHHRGVDYECQSWMTGTKTIGQVRKGGKLIFASYTDYRRVQEYVPEAKFVNGTESRNVLLEYDYAVSDGGWPRLVPFDFACGPGTIALNRYIGAHPTDAEQYINNMQPPTEMTETTLNGRPCYWFHLRDNANPGTLTWDLYLDSKTCEPVRLSRIIETTDGKRTKDDVYDYTFEHLPNDDGIRWGLDVDKLERQANAPTPPPSQGPPASPAADKGH